MNGDDLGDRMKMYEAYIKQTAAEIHRSTIKLAWHIGECAAFLARGTRLKRKTVVIIAHDRQLNRNV